MEPIFETPFGNAAFPEMRHAPGVTPGKIDTGEDFPPEKREEEPLGIPVGDPPTPNRAWTEMRAGADIDDLSEEEKAELYLGRDSLF